MRISKKPEIAFRLEVPPPDLDREKHKDDLVIEDGREYLKVPVEVPAGTPSFDTMEELNAFEKEKAMMIMSGVIKMRLPDAHEDPRFLVEDDSDE